MKTPSLSITRRRFGEVGVALAGVLAATLAVPRTTYAERAASEPRVEIIVLYAKNDPKGPHRGRGVPDLPQLSLAPFNAYNAFELVGKTVLMLDHPKEVPPWQGKASGTYGLPNGKPLEIALVKQRADGRYHMGAAIGKESPDVVRWNTPAGEPVFIAGQSYKDGILVIGITLRVPS